MEILRLNSKSEPDILAMKSAASEAAPSSFQAAFPGLSSAGGLLRLRRGGIGREVVTNVGPADPEDNVFGDVSGVVADALEVARNDERVEGFGGALRVFLDQRAESAEGVAVQLVDLIIKQ